MKKNLFCTGLFVLLMSQLASAQHFIGLNKDETKSLARESGFYQDNMVVSQKFNYLKFVNSADTKTFIVFFSEEDISTHTRTVCDYSEFSYVVEDMDKNYRKMTDTSWVYENGKQEYEVTLEEKEWYFVIRTKKK